MIIRTESISFPRSGHGPLHNALKRYFGDRLVYCDAQNQRGRHCGCRSVPCVNPMTNFSKNHDFDLKKGAGLEVRRGAALHRAVSQPGAVDRQRLQPAGEAQGGQERARRLARVRRRADRLLEQADRQVGARAARADGSDLDLPLRAARPGTGGSPVRGDRLHDRRKGRSRRPRAGGVLRRHQAEEPAGRIPPLRCRVLPRAGEDDRRPDEDARDSPSFDDGV